jgi:hypothetical protein
MPFTVQFLCACKAIYSTTVLKTKAYQLQVIYDFVYYSSPRKNTTLSCDRKKKTARER